MEDEVRSSIARNIGGQSGQKRKRKEEEEDPSSIQIARSRRLEMLESIVCVLKCFNSVLRFHVPADGDLGFSLETGSLEEQRIAGLIYSHVCSYILLFHLENKRRTDEDRSRGSDPSSSSDVEIVVHACEGGAVPTVGREVDDMLWNVLFLDDPFTQPLIDGRRALVDDPTLRPRNGNGGAIEVSSMFDELRDYNKGRRKQELLDVLHTLEVAGRARGYAPPEDDEEVMCYKEIRKQMASYILHVHSRKDFLARIGEKPCNYPLSSDPFCYPEEPSSLCFVPPLHQLEVSFEQMPEHLSLLKECKQRVTQLLSSGPTTVSDRVRDLVTIIRAKDASRSALLSWTPTKASSVKPLSDCLDHVIDILRCIRSLGEQTPTEKVVRMYAQIGEHVRSSIWLSHSIPCSQRKDKRSCEVYFDRAFTDHDHSSLSKPDAQGKHVGTREQLLEEILVYLRACRSSCMDDVPSLEEEKKYLTIWMELYPGLLVCLRSRPIRLVYEEPAEEISGLELLVLERKVCYIFKRVLCFLEEVKEELSSVAAVVHRALRPEEQLSPEGALGWFMTCKDDAATKAKEFVDRSMSLGSMAKLEHALQVLVELGNVGTYLFKVSSAVDSVEAWHDVKKYAMVASEVENAFDIICNEKLPVN